MDQVQVASAHGSIQLVQIHNTLIPLSQEEEVIRKERVVWVRVVPMEQKLIAIPSAAYIKGITFHVRPTHVVGLLKALVVLLLNVLWRMLLIAVCLVVHIRVIPQHVLKVSVITVAVK
tara:strand:- start:585 stop:938 length:354 start_codon:yes stop_codon:yes gene_type:complete